MILFEATGSLLESVGVLFVTLWHLLAPWALLIVWGLFWLLAVDWRPFVGRLKEGAWPALLLLGIAAVLIWGSLEPTPHQVLGVELQNHVGKAVIVGFLYLLAFVAGALQLAWLRRKVA